MTTTPTTTTQNDEPKSTMAIMQNELLKKWEREQAEQEREARLTDEPLGPDLPQTFADEQAFYEFHGGVSEGDTIDWGDGEVVEVIGVVPAQRLVDPEFDILGDIIHYRVIKEIDDADTYSYATRVGEQNDTRDYVLGAELANGRATIHRGEN